MLMGGWRVNVPSAGRGGEPNDAHRAAHISRHCFGCNLIWMTKLIGIEAQLMSMTCLALMYFPFPIVLKLLIFNIFALIAVANIRHNVV